MVPLEFNLEIVVRVLSHAHSSHEVVAKIFKLYPPSWLYVRRTLKEIILAAEKDGEEVSDGLYELHAIYLLPPQVTDQLVSLVSSDQGHCGISLYRKFNMSMYLRFTVKHLKVYAGYKLTEYDCDRMAPLS